MNDIILAEVLNEALLDEYKACEMGVAAGKGRGPGRGRGHR